jgi:tetratricopeptide (TPR) repeat protein
MRIAGDLTNRGAILRSLGRFEEAIADLEEAVRLTESIDPGRRTEALYVLHTVHRARGDEEAAERYLERVLEISGDARLRVQMPFPMSAMANLLVARGETVRAIELFERAIEIGRQSRYAFGLAHCLRGLGELLVRAGRPDEALPHLREAADLARRLVDRDAEIALLEQTASILAAKGQHRDAADCWERLLELTRENGPLQIAARALRGLAACAEQAGHVDAAVRWMREVLPLCDGVERGNLLNEIGIREWSRGRVDRALDAFREALALFERLSQPTPAGLMLNSIGSCLLRLERLDEADEVLRRATDVTSSSGQLLLEGHALGLRGDVALARGDPRAARGFYERSLALRQRSGDRRGEGWMSHHLARACRAAGDLDLARDHASRSAAIAEQIRDGELAEACQRLLGEIS